MNNSETAKIFENLFIGLQRGYGLLHSDVYRYIKGQPTTELYQQHLEGKISLGIVPITDKGNCRFGVIDDEYFINEIIGIDELPYEEFIKEDKKKEGSNE